MNLVYLIEWSYQDELFRQLIDCILARSAMKYRTRKAMGKRFECNFATRSFHGNHTYSLLINQRLVHQLSMQFCYAHCEGEEHDSTNVPGNDGAHTARNHQNRNRFLVFPSSGDPRVGSYCQCCHISVENDNRDHPPATSGPSLRRDAERSPSLRKTLPLMCVWSTILCPTAARLNCHK